MSPPAMRLVPLYKLYSIFFTPYPPSLTVPLITFSSVSTASPSTGAVTSRTGSFVS